MSRSQFSKSVLFLILCVFLSFSFAKDMTQGELHYNLALYSINNLGSIPTLCADSAINNPNTEFMCANHSAGHEAFINAWEGIANSQVIRGNYVLTPVTDWMYFNGPDNTVDYYAKAYKLGGQDLIVAYDPSEQGREIFFSVGAVPIAMDSAEGDLGLGVSTTIGTNCEYFGTQAEAIAFFKAGRFNSAYDPYELDVDKNGIPCD